MKYFLFMCPETDKQIRSLNLDTSIAAIRGFSQKSIKEWQTVQNLIEWLITNLHCLQRYLYWPVGMKGLMFL